jgi:hypothetical protein
MATALSYQYCDNCMGLAGLDGVEVCWCPPANASLSLLLLLLLLYVL